MSPRALRSRVLLAASLVGLGWLALAACSVEPREIHLGEDECNYCRMRIVDPKFAAQLVTKTGRAYPFDAVECLAAFDLEGRVAAEEVHGRWVSDFREPGRWLAAEDAHFLRSAALKSPMALDFSAYASASEVDAQEAEYGGTQLTWEAVREQVREAWLDGAGRPPR